MKVADWDQKLIEFVELKRNEPFAWGKNDCFLFAMDCVEMLRGEDVAKELRGKYKTMIGAVKLQAKLESIKWLDRRFVRHEHINLTQRGSIVCYQHPTHKPAEALGICVGAEFVAPGEHGIEFMPLSHATISWSV